MTAERRLAKLEGALSPKAATLLWLAEAQEFGSLPAYVEWLIDQPISADPLERVPAQARASALEAMRGQPREAVREAAHRAVRDAIFGVELVLKLNVVAEEAMRLSRLRYAALFWEMRAISTEAQLETAGPSRAKDGRRTPRWAAWQAAVGSLIGSLYAECTRIALIGERARPARHAQQLTDFVLGVSVEHRQDEGHAGATVKISQRPPQIRIDRHRPHLVGLADRKESPPAPAPPFVDCEAHPHDRQPAGDIGPRR